jgi:hypothetical protein
MLVPLFVKLTDSEIYAVGGVVAEASNGVEDSGGVLEEIGSARLLIHQESLLPYLHIEPVHGKCSAWRASSSGLNPEFSYHRAALLRLCRAAALM